MPHWEMVDEAMADILRQKTPAQRLAIAFDMANFVQTMIKTNLGCQNPDWTPERIQRETARRISHGVV